MRSAIAVAIAVAVASAPAAASAEAPVAVRLDYTRGPGAETCPAEPSGLRAQVAAHLGYDPFERSDARERVIVVVSSAPGNAWSARVERYNAAGVRTYGPETFPDPPLQGDCAALVSPLAAYLRGLVLRGGRPPAAVVAPLAPTVQPANPPALPSVPNPARSTASRVAIVFYAAGATFLLLGVGWSVYAQSQRNAAIAQSEQARSDGTMGCSAGSVSGADCQGILRAWQSSDAAHSLRNGWFVAAGASVAGGAIATVWAVTLPATVRAPPQTQVRVIPGGLVVRGAF